MTLVFDAEQRLLAETARDLFAAQSPPAALRRLRDSRDPLGYDRALWRQIIDLGWTATPFPESVGGIDFGFKGLGAVFERAGATLAASPMLSSVVLGGSLLLAAGADQQAWLPQVIRGETLFALAVDEGAHHHPAGIRLAARAAGGGYVLDGDKAFVMDGHVADRLIVAARTAGAPGEQAGLTLFNVDARAAGVEVARAWMVDGRNAASVRLRGVQVDAMAVIGPVGQGHGLLEGALDRGRTCLAAEMLGIAQALFDMTVAYLKERVQFDVPIGSFQALQHRAAWLYAELELARSAVMAALDAVDRDGADRAALVSLAKWKMGVTVARVSDEAVQMHGGIGVTEELDVGLYLKRGRVAARTFGDVDFHRSRYARLSGVPA